MDLFRDGLRALIDLPYLAGRMNPMNGLQNSLVVDDTHAATPQSMIAQSRAMLARGDFVGAYRLSETAAAKYPRSIGGMKLPCTNRYSLRCRRTHSWTPSSWRRAIHRFDSANSVTICAVFFANPR